MNTRHQGKKKKVEHISKKQAKNIILKCARIYNKQLLDRTLMFVSIDDSNEIKCLEANFSATNFLHLTGVYCKMSPSRFYQTCVNRMLQETDFEFDKKGTTVLKMQILEKVMNIHKTADIITDYNGSRFNLKTDKLAGEKKSPGKRVAILGLLKTGKRYSPNTALKENFKSLKVPGTEEKVVAVFSKTRFQKYYNSLLRIEDNFDIKNLPEEIARKIDFDDLKGIELKQPAVAIKPSIKDKIANATKRAAEDRELVAAAKSNDMKQGKGLQDTSL